MKQARARPPAPPQEVLKGLPLSVEQTGTLIPRMLEIRAETLDDEGLARASANLKQRMRDLNLARTALANLTKAFATPFRNDLIEVMEEPPHSLSLSRRSKPIIRKSVLFLELLPVVKSYIDKMTAADIRERWSGDDRRAVNRRRIDSETDAVFDLVQKAGFALEEPDRPTLELVRRVFSYTTGKTVGISMVRKRLKMWKIRGKQSLCAFHDE
jgi:hypothetical protein